MNLIIKALDNGDYPGAYAFQCEYLDCESYENFLHRVNAYPELYLGAFLGGELVGICYGEPSKRETSSICLQGIAVTLDAKKNLARKGIGSKLLESFENAVKQRGFHRISLGSAEDVKVENFYLKNGYLPYELVVKGSNREELERLNITDYEAGKLLKPKLQDKYHPEEIIFIFQKRI